MPHDQAWRDKWQPPSIEHGKPTQWGWTVYYPQNLKLGKFVDIGWGTFINARYGVTIGDYAEIGPLCAILSDSSIDGQGAVVTIRRAARVGAHCTLMPGVWVGENSVVGAHSFVKAMVPDNSIAFGVPARVVKKPKPGLRIK